MRAALSSALFAVWLAAATVVFSFVAIAVSRLSAHRRYHIISSTWSRAVTEGARMICGIRWKVIGMRNLPASPCVILSRHESAWETIAFQRIFPPQVFVLKRELLNVPFFGWGLRRMSPIPIDRASGASALRRMRDAGLARLRDGFYVVVFPEGTRARPGENPPHHSGGAFIAKAAGVPAVPVTLDSGKCWPRRGFLKRAGVVTVRIGPPIDCAELSPAEITRRARAWMEENAAG